MRKILMLGAAMAFATSNYAAGMGLEIGFGVGWATNILNKSNQAIYGGLAGGGGADKYVGDLSTTNTCSVKAGAGGAITTSTCTSPGEGGKTSTSALDYAVFAQYDLSPTIGLPLFVRSGFNFAMGFNNDYSVTYTENVTAAAAGFAVGDSIKYELTYKTEAYQWEIPILLGIDLIKTEKSTVYFAAGISISKGQYEHTLGANDTGTGSATAQAQTRKYLDVTNRISGSSIGTTYILGGKHEIADGILLFAEVKWLANAASDAEVTGTMFDKDNSHANEHAIFGALGESTQTQLSVSGAVPKPLQGNNTTAATSGAINGTRPFQGTSIPKTVLNLSYTRWNVGARYAL